MRRAHDEEERRGIFDIVRGKSIPDPLILTGRISSAPLPGAMPPEVLGLAEEARGGDRDADATDIILETPGAPPLDDQCGKQLSRCITARNRKKKPRRKHVRKSQKWEGKRFG
jgi:hypothetical protein